jgi:hypothetical protein
LFDTSAQHPNTSWCPNVEQVYNGGNDCGGTHGCRTVAEMQACDPDMAVNDLLTDMKLVDPANEDYRLRPDSPGRDSGLAVGSSQTPREGAPDRGPLEYLAVPGILATH